MKKASIFVFAIASCLCLSMRIASAHDVPESHPIDTELEKRIDADPSTYGMIEAYKHAAEDWDKLLNENYKALMEMLDGEQRERLRASQREWVRYRDLEFEFNGHYWAGFEGTIHRPFPFAFRADFVRERALRLGHYLQDLNEGAVNEG